jgi:hypothetical protein
MNSVTLRSEFMTSTELKVGGGPISWVCVPPDSAAGVNAGVREGV